MYALFLFSFRRKRFWYIGSVFRPCHSVLNTFNRIFHLRQPNLAFLTAADLFSITDNDSLCLFRAVFFLDHIFPAKLTAHEDHENSAEEYEQIQGHLYGRVSFHI